MCVCVGVCGYVWVWVCTVTLTNSSSLLYRAMSLLRVRTMISARIPAAARRQRYTHVSTQLRQDRKGLPPEFIRSYLTRTAQWRLSCRWQTSGSGRHSCAGRCPIARPRLSHSPASERCTKMSLHSSLCVYG